MVVYVQGFLSKCQGEMEEEDGKYPSWHSPIYPTAKGSTEAEMNLHANSVNSEPERFHPSSPHKMTEANHLFYVPVLPSLTSSVRQRGLKFSSAFQACRKEELICLNTRIPALKAQFSCLTWKLR